MCVCVCVCLCQCAAIPRAERLEALWAGDDVEKVNMLLGDALLDEDFDGFEGAAACGEHGVEEEDVALGNVLRQLCVEEVREGCLLVALDQNLPDAHAPAALLQRLLHRLASPHDAVEGVMA